MEKCEKGCLDCEIKECSGGGKCPSDNKHCHDMDFHHFSDYEDLRKNWCKFCDRYKRKKFRC